MEFASLERPGSLPDGVLDAINAATGWLHTGDPALLLHTDKLFASLREKLSDRLVQRPAEEPVAAEPVQVIQTPALPKKDEEDAAPARNDGKLVLDHPLTVADLGDGDRSAAGTVEPLAGAELLHHPSKGSLYLNFYYDLGECTPEEVQYLDLLTDILDELDTPSTLPGSCRPSAPPGWATAWPASASGPGGRRAAPATQSSPGT